MALLCENYDYVFRQTHLGSCILAHLRIEVRRSRKAARKKGLERKVPNVRFFEMEMPKAFQDFHGIPRCSFGGSDGKDCEDEFCISFWERLFVFAVESKSSSRYRVGATCTTIASIHDTTLWFFPYKSVRFILSGTNNIADILRMCIQIWGWVWMGQNSLLHFITVCWGTNIH